jgi:hypothetical protein
MMVLGLLKRISTRGAKLLKFTYMALLIHFRSAFLVTSFTGTTCSFTPKYCEAFQNAACAETGTTLIDPPVSVH